ncbi:MAG: type II toxin-antitoxin system RelE/ParE family toxin [Planctomycetes bacterium]|nr:type II toxin-antitoxin system RelE/ParE family toxin [Planctomycetota bacterium]
MKRTTKPIRMVELAAKEARKAWLWYRKRSTRAGGRFQQTLEHAVDQIREQPESWPEYQHGTQFVRLKRFPYIVVFRELDTEVQIVAVAHAHRRPGYWKRRLK